MGKSKDSKFTPEEQDKIYAVVREGLIQGLTVKEMADKASQAVNKVVAQTSIKQRLTKLKIRLESDWKDTLVNGDANNQLAFLRLESLYAKCLQESDTKTAFAVWKEQWGLLKNVGTVTRKKSEKQISDYQSGVPQDDLEDLDDDALLSKINQGEVKGAIPVQYANQLIQEDHGG